MAVRTARIVAVVAFIASLAAVVPAALVVRVAPGSIVDVRLLWVLLPISACSGVVVLAGRTSVAPVWFLTGACWGFVVLGAWSLGLFFAPAALFLLGAAIAHLVIARPGFRAAVAPLWFLWGATGVAALFFVRDWAVAFFGSLEITSAPAIVAGTWAFAALTPIVAITRIFESRQDAV